MIAYVYAVAVGLVYIVAALGLAALVVEGVYRWRDR